MLSFELLSLFSFFCYKLNKLNTKSKKNKRYEICSHFSLKVGISIDNNLCWIVVHIWKTICWLCIIITILGFCVVTVLQIAPSIICFRSNSFVHSPYSREEKENTSVFLFLILIIMLWWNLLRRYFSGFETTKP